MARLSKMVALAVMAFAALVAARAPIRPMEISDEDPGPSIQSILELPTGFAAMMMCSGIFVAGLPYDTVFDEDCDVACLLANVTVDYTERSVTAFLTGSGDWPVKSIYRGDGLGCTVVDGITEAELRAQNIGDQSALPPLNATVAWPQGDLVDFSNLPSDVDWAAINQAVADDFACERCNTRGIMIVHRGRIVLEQYAPGVTRATRLLGWSGTKSVTSAFVGVLVGEGRLSLDQRMPVAEWNVEPNDVRSTVTLRNMLHMASGQLWREASGDVRCLFIAAEGNCAGWYANQPNEVPPGSQYEYSTGGSTLLMRTVLEQRGDSQWTNFEFPRQKLFKRLSMNSALIEAQSNQYLLGGSNAYMQLRDWARLGLLYLRDGVWVDGNRILPEGWVDFTSTPSPTRSSYGGHWWISNNPIPNFYMSGFRNQNVWVFKSKDLVVCRFSMPPLLGSPFSSGAFLTPIVNAFPDAK